MQLYYVCNYCNNTQYVKLGKVTVCSGCGASDFMVYDTNGDCVDTAVLLKKRHRKIVTLMLLFFSPIILIVGLFIFLCICGFVDGVANIGDFQRVEYVYSDDLCDNSALYLGRQGEGLATDYNTEIVVVGDYNKVYENIYGGIYKSQFVNFDIVLPVNLTLDTADFSIRANELKMDYYSTMGTMSVDFEVKGAIPRDTEIYLVDNADNRFLVLIEKYSRDDYKTMADYFERNSLHTYNFSIDSDIKEYKAIMFVVNNEEYSYPLDYTMAKGSVCYYALKEKH